ncbi:hypothetical protein HDV04_005933 [Boothiomyces sp. JEL0838]|nr:hypothetical protein HDV04_005933 [Boothiomyces sp. JEL0838]
MTNIVFQTAWLSSNCIGPPDTMMTFNETNPSPLYLSNIDYNPIPYCGVDLNYVDLGCCLSSLNLTRTLNYLAYSRNYLGDYTLQQSIPKSANGQEYCYIQSLNTSALFGYQDIYIKSSGVCLEDRLEIYTNDGCQGLDTNISVSSTVANITTVIGNVGVSLFTDYEAQMMLIYFVYQHMIFTDPNLMNIYSFVLVITDFASVMSNVTSLMILYNIFTVINPWVKGIGITVLFLIFFGLNGIGYYVWYEEIVSPDMFMQYYDLSNTLANAWDTFSLAFNYVPPFWIFVNVIKVQYFKQRTSDEKKNMFLINRNLYLIIALQILIGIIVCLINFELMYLVNTDRQFLALGQFVNYIKHWNFVFLVALFEELTVVTKNILQGKVEQTEKQVRLLDLVSPISSGSVNQKTVLEQKTIVLKKQE